MVNYVCRFSIGIFTKRKQVILCAVDKNEYMEVEKVVTEVDEKAFIIVTDTRHIVGNRFKNLV